MKIIKSLIINIPIMVIMYVAIYFILTALIPNNHNLKDLLTVIVFFNFVLIKWSL